MIRVLNGTIPSRQTLFAAADQLNVAPTNHNKKNWGVKKDGSVGAKALPLLRCVRVVLQHCCRSRTNLVAPCSALFSRESKQLGVVTFYRGLVSLLCFILLLPRVSFN